MAGVMLALLCAAAGPASAAEPPLPPKLDVQAAMKALESQQIYRAPGAVAELDEDLVRAGVSARTRVLVAPFTGRYREGGNYADGGLHTEQVYSPLKDWAAERDLVLVTVEGLDVGSSGISATPSTVDELRTRLAYREVTEPVLAAAHYGETRQKEGAPPGRPVPPVLAPDPGSLDALVARLRENPVYNDPARGVPIDFPVDLLRDKRGIGIRIAALPALTPGAPYVDYAPALAAAFPEDVVVVSHGDWIDAAGGGQPHLVSARDYAYGRFENATFQQGADISDRIGTIVLRADDLLGNKAFSRPQPAPFDPARTMSTLAPWVLLGSALVLGGGSLARWRRGQANRAEAERQALRSASGAAFAEIAALGGLVAAARKGTDILAAAAERHATASTMYEQATTADGMRAVTEIAAEGRAMLAGRS
ncbi:hypothetical protein CFN78_02450 [Amycolatopsis antarctica]|uniref:DUF4350 domain-containing protein n=1 Tax=Amycolatopsis antarctica TaxID=1854586 RepID=A0A263DAQ1_9PSEU|nr:hypothetical protein CFN78_02450 [Amycolatopsis antarctica]